MAGVCLMVAALSRPLPKPIPLALVVDAPVDTHDLYREDLCDAVQTIIYASDGATAFALATHRCPQVVLTEVRLPGVDGFELCEALRNDPGTAATWIVVVTADTRPIVIARAKQAGADAVLTKPVSPAALMETIPDLAASSPRVLHATVQRRFSTARDPLAPSDQEI